MTTAYGWRANVTCLIPIPCCVRISLRGLVVSRANCWGACLAANQRYTATPFPIMIPSTTKVWGLQCWVWSIIPPHADFFLVSVYGTKQCLVLRQFTCSKHDTNVIATKDSRLLKPEHNPIVTGNTHGTTRSHMLEAISGAGLRLAGKWGALEQGPHPPMFTLSY